MKSAFVRVAAAAALLVLSGCRSEPAATEDAAGPPPPAVPGKPAQIYVFAYPLEFLAVRMAGDSAEVHFPVPAGVDPAHWEPTPEELEKIQQADAILIVGSGNEPWLEHSSVPEDKIVDTVNANSERFIKLPEAVVHKHGPDGEHTHEGWAPAAWLDLVIFDGMTHPVRDTLSKFRPDAQGTHMGAWMALAPVLGNLSHRATLLAQARPDTKVISSHPVFHYLMANLNWPVKSVHWEPGAMPSDEEWTKFAALHAEHPAKLMLWEGEPAEEVRQRLADEFEITCVVIDALAHRPESGDFISAMNENFARIEEALGVETPELPDAPPSAAGVPGGAPGPAGDR